MLGYRRAEPAGSAFLVRVTGRECYNRRNISEEERMAIQYPVIKKGRFVSRPNRFVIFMEMDGKIVKAHMPNPGRMRELLFPGVMLYAAPHAKEGSRTQYRIVGVDREGEPVPLDTSRANDTAEWLINHGKIPGWEAYRVLRREVTMGDSRFDLLLGNEAVQFPVEVKSCTLFGKNGAMFPDAVTARGRKHVLHLGDIGKNGGRAGLLVLVQWDRARWFLPDYHTDPEFAEAFRSVAPYIDWKAAALQWTPDFTVPAGVRLLPSPLEILDQESGNRGDYLLVLHLDTAQDIEIGSRGILHFPEGYYVYTGSARKNLDQRMARHRRLRKGMHWHIDWLRQKAEWVGCIPIRTAEDLEHQLVTSVSRIADWEIPGFGCTDCHCPTHLFGFHENPMHLPGFVQIEEDFEINRLDSLVHE